MNWALYRFPLRPVTLPVFLFAHGHVVERWLWAHFMTLLLEKHCVRNLFYFFCTMTNNSQLVDKFLYCSYMFRHYCVILRELVVSNLLSYTSMSVHLLVI